MTEFQYELLKFLYYLLMSTILVVKIVFLTLIAFMLADYIVIILKELRMNLNKKEDNE